MIAKFTVESVFKTDSSVELRMLPVSGSFDKDGNSEDNSFARWTPSGELRMTITNPALFDTFKQGDAYYLSFSQERPGILEVLNPVYASKIDGLQGAVSSLQAVAATLHELQSRVATALAGDAVSRASVAIVSPEQSAAIANLEAIQGKREADVPAIEYVPVHLRSEKDFH